jgi:hypothetical protein
MAAQRFCTFCGAARADQLAAYCMACGRSYSVVPQPTFGEAPVRQSASLAGPTGSTALLENARKRPLWTVFLLTAGTLSFYFFVHLGLMWAEMKRARADPSMNPLGHFFAQFVPVYDFFRFHAHVRTLDEMLESAGSPHRVSAGPATVIYIVISAFAVFAGSQLTADWLIFPSYAAYGAFGAWRQRALNAYYDHISQGTIPERVHPSEWVVMILGGLLLALAAIGTFLPTT